MRRFRNVAPSARKWHKISGPRYCFLHFHFKEISWLKLRSFYLGLVLSSHIVFSSDEASIRSRSLTALRKYKVVGSTYLVL